MKKFWQRPLVGLAVPLLWAVLGGCRPHVMLSDEGFRPSAAVENKKLLEAVEQRSAAVQTMRVRIRTTVRRGLVASKDTAAVVFVRPDRLRLEFFSSNLLRLSALLAANDGRLMALDLNRRVYYTGAATAANVEKVLSIPFTPEQFMLWLSGAPFVSSPGEVEVLIAQGKPRFMLKTPFQEDKRLALLLFDASGCEQGWESPDLAACIRPEAIEIRDKRKGNFIFYSSYEYARDSGELRRINFELPAMSVSGSLNFEDRSPESSELPERLFLVPAPGSAAVIDLDQASKEALSPLL